MGVTTSDRRGPLQWGNGRLWTYAFPRPWRFCPSWRLPSTAWRIPTTAWRLPTTAGLAGLAGGALAGGLLGSKGKLAASALGMGSSKMGGMASMGGMGGMMGSGMGGLMGGKMDKKAAKR